MAPLPDFLLLPAHELQARFNDGSLTSVDLCRATLAHMEALNRKGPCLNAIVSVCPHHIVLARARGLDEDRRQGNILGPLHGIPIVLKDVFLTDYALGMPTTAGASALASMKATKNAAIVKQLLDAGVIIIGKGNLTEFCGMKSNNTPLGWSAYGGQTKSAYWRDDLEKEDQPSPGGSSVGPAVAVAAGFCTVSVGSETAGSAVFPASLAGLYAIKLTPGAASSEGVFRLSTSFDSVGALGRDPIDVAALAEAMRLPQNTANLQGAAREGEWRGLSVGFADILWGIYPDQKDRWEDPAVRSQYEAAASKIRAAGAKVVCSLDLPEYGTVMYEEQTLTTIAYYEFAGEVSRFIQYFDEKNGINNLADIVAWNETNASTALPEQAYGTQTELKKALTPNMTAKMHDTAAVELRRIAGENGLAKAMDENGLDIIITASESAVVGFAAVAGWPIATVPLGNLKPNGQPFGLFAVARQGREDLLFKFMGAFSRSFPKPEQPPLLRI